MQKNLIDKFLKTNRKHSEDFVIYFKMIDRLRKVSISCQQFLLEINSQWKTPKHYFSSLNTFIIFYIISSQGICKNKKKKKTTIQHI